MINLFSLVSANIGARSISPPGKISKYYPPPLVFEIFFLRAFARGKRRSPLWQKILWRKEGRNGRETSWPDESRCSFSPSPSFFFARAAGGISLREDLANGPKEAIILVASSMSSGREGTGMSVWKAPKMQNSISAKQVQEEQQQQQKNQLQQQQHPPLSSWSW